MERKHIHLFARHAINHLRFWGLTEPDVINALEQPDLVTPTHQGRWNAWKQDGERWLRVTYSENGREFFVYTVTVRKHGPPEDLP